MHVCTYLYVATRLIVDSVGALIQLTPLYWCHVIKKKYRPYFMIDSESLIWELEHMQKWKWFDVAPLRNINLKIKLLNEVKIIFITLKKITNKNCSWGRILTVEFFY